MIALVNRSKRSVEEQDECCSEGKRTKNFDNYMMDAITKFTNKSGREEVFDELRSKLTFQSQFKGFEKIVSPLYNRDNVVLDSKTAIPQLGNIVFLFVFVYYFQDEIFPEKVIYHEKLQIDQKEYESWIQSILERDVNSFSFDEYYWLADAMSSCFQLNDQTKFETVQQTWMNRSFPECTLLTPTTFPFIIIGPSGVLNFKQITELIYFHRRNFGFSFIPLSLNPWVNETSNSNDEGVIWSHEMFDYEYFHGSVTRVSFNKFAFEQLHAYYDACNGSEFQRRMFRVVVWYFFHHSVHLLRDRKQLFDSKHLLFSNIYTYDLKNIVEYITGASDFEVYFPDGGALRRKHLDACKDLDQLFQFVKLHAIDGDLAKLMKDRDHQKNLVFSSFVNDVFVKHVELVQLQL